MPERGSLSGCARRLLNNGLRPLAEMGRTSCPGRPERLGPPTSRSGLYSLDPEASPGKSLRSNARPGTSHRVAPRRLFNLMNLFRLIKTWLTVVTIGLSCAGFTHGAEADAELRALLAKIPTTAEGDLGISPAETSLAKQIQAHGAAAIPYLLPLLQHDEARVRQFAGYVLRDTAGLTKAHLDALIAARRRGDGWIPPAIGRIGTPRALAFLVEELRKEPEAESQLGFAFTQAGKRGAVALAEVFNDRTPSSSAICQRFARTAEPRVPKWSNSSAMKTGICESVRRVVWATSATRKGRRR